MGESNAQYYARRDPLGAMGDFTTAPEISQMFGELVGLWLADAWQRAGQATAAIYAELGPGRGTLARDALRALASAGLNPRVHLVEGSPILRDSQTAALSKARFHHDLGTVPEDGALLLVANEFFDALPIRQLVRTEFGWRERMVGRAGDGFGFVAGRQPVDQIVPKCWEDSPQGTILEINPGAAAVVEEIARRLMCQGGAALIIDYGHLEPRSGSTLQAVRKHRKVDPLAHPNEADLTAHVDFATLSGIAERAGCRVQTATQGAWLKTLGIDTRARFLAQTAPDQAAAIEAARTRLTEPDHMGELFKVMAITAPNWPAGAGFNQ